MKSFPLDLITQTGTARELLSPVLFHCPYCERPVTLARLLRYPEQLAGCFAPVYRCGCGKHIGAPVVSDKEIT